MGPRPADAVGVVEIGGDAEVLGIRFSAPSSLLKRLLKDFLLGGYLIQNDGFLVRVQFPGGEEVKIFYRVEAESAVIKGDGRVVYIRAKVGHSVC